MGRPQIQKIIPHIVHLDNPRALSARLDDLHIQVIERFLRRSDLTPAQQVKVIDLIAQNLKGSPT